MTLYYEEDCKPYKKYDSDAGFDLKAKSSAFLEPFETVVIKTGTYIELEKNNVGIVKGRSGLSAKGIIVGGGVIDPGYTGEIGVVLHNMNKKPFIVVKGDRIAQLLVVPFLSDAEVFLSDAEVKEYNKDDIEKSERNSNGFGSTGK